MKLELIVGLLTLGASVGSQAAPFVANNPAPSVIGAAPAGEQSLQAIADGLFGAGAVNVNTDQSPAGLFASATPSSASLIPTLVAEFTANAGSQVFGIWFGTDTSNVVGYDLLLGGATANQAVGITINNHTLDVFAPPSGCGTAFACGSHTNALIDPTSFGFYFRASPSAPTYYSLDQLNPGPRTDRVVSFEDGTTTNWLFAYEDGTDFDYNDMAVKVESITAAVPEPETYAMLVAGLGVMGFIARRRKS